MISNRLREERQRLGLTQTAFGALAGVTKSAQIKWEAGTSSAPTAPALAAFADAGADVLYILTGRRTADRPDNAASQIEDDLAAVRRDLVEPERRRLPDESLENAEQRVLFTVRNRLKAIRDFDRPFTSPEVKEEVEHLLDVAENPASLALYRAADHMQFRRKRTEMKEHLAFWFEGGPYNPTGDALNTLVRLALDYTVPVKMLVELVHEIHDEIERSRDPKL